MRIMVFAGACFLCLSGSAAGMAEGPPDQCTQVAAGPGTVGDKSAFCYWLPRAQAGDAAAQYNVGLLFKNGPTSGRPRNDDEAAKWFELSAKQGSVSAMRNLAAVRESQGKSDAAATWLEVAVLVEQQQVAQHIADQQQVDHGIRFLAP